MAGNFSTATEALEALRAGAISAEALTAACLERIAARNTDIRAVSDVLGDSALATARDIDRRRADGGPLGALAGLPVLVKDLVDVAGAVAGRGWTSLPTMSPPTTPSWCGACVLRTQ